MIHKNRTKIFSFLFLAMLFLIGCSSNYEYSKDGVLVTASVSPSGPDDFRNLIGEHITIYTDGRLVLSKSDTYEEQEPIIEKEIDSSKIKELKKVIEQEQFKKLEEDVSAPSEDGSKYQLSVNFIDEEKKVTGWNPDDENFLALHDFIFDLVSEEEEKNWRTKIEEFVWDKHSLRTNNKDEYKEDGPFFTLTMETPFSSDDASKKFLENISLDLNGNLTFSIVDKDLNELTRFSKFKKEIDKENVEEFQDIILENFWKLNENQRNNEKNLMEIMTVYMTDEEKTVEGQEPDHPRYIKIKDKILSFIDREDYEEWQKKTLEQAE